jgi:hypothetical protein
VTETIDEQQENTNKVEDEVIPTTTTNTNVMAVDETNTEVQPTVMVKKLLNIIFVFYFFINRNKKQHRV